MCYEESKLYPRVVFFIWRRSGPGTGEAQDRDIPGPGLGIGHTGRLSVQTVGRILWN